MENMIAKIAKLEAAQVKEIIIAMMNDERDAAGAVLEAAMEALESKIGTDAFVEFANAI